LNSHQKDRKKQKRHTPLLKTMFLVLLERLDDTMLFVTLESSPWGKGVVRWFDHFWTFSLTVIEY
jgi:hypothetical protein